MYLVVDGKCHSVSRGEISGFELLNDRIQKIQGASAASAERQNHQIQEIADYNIDGQKSKKRKIDMNDDSSEKAKHKTCNDSVVGKVELRSTQHIGGEETNNAGVPNRESVDATTLENSNTEANDEIPSWRASLKRKDVRSGRLSDEEKALLHKAIVEFAELNGFSTNDFSWMIVPGTGKRQIQSKSTMGMWKYVSKSLPNRTIKSVAAAGLRMFHPNAKKGRWKDEEDSKLLRLAKELGNRWSEISTHMGRTAEACRDRWKEIRLENQKRKGPWSESEVELLKQTVTEFLERRAQALASSTREDVERSMRREVLDDINWVAISSAVGTRSGLQCMEKWYDQLRPSMIVTGEWGIGDDRRMLRALYRLQPRAEFEVPWEDLVPKRTAQQTRRRWRLMIKSVKDYRNKSMADVVEELVMMHMPQLKETGSQAPNSTDKN